MLSIDGQEVRYDLSERYPGALGDLGGGPRLVLRDDEQGEQARATLQAADNATGHVEIEGGTGVLWPEVPVGLRGLLPEQPLWGGATIIPMEVDELPPPDPVLLALIIAGSTELAVRFVQAEEPLPGWDGTMIGSTGGLELTQSARMHDGKLMLDQLGWRHNLGVGTATEQHLSAKLLLAALEGDEVVIEIGGDEGEVGRAWLALNDHSSDEEDIANLRTHVSFLEYACEVQAWLGVPLFPPARVSKEDTTELGRALGMIRQPQATGTWTDIQLSTDTNHPVADEGEVEVVIFQPVLAKFFGVEQYIGMEALHFDSVTVHRDGHSTVLRPGNNNAVTTELLHPDKMSVEAARQGSSGGAAGCCSSRPAPTRTPTAAPTAASRRRGPGDGYAASARRARCRRWRSLLVQDGQASASRRWATKGLPHSEQIPIEAVFQPTIMLPSSFGARKV